MAHLFILHRLDGSPEGEQILAEFEQRTGLAPDVRADDRYYELRDEDHRERVVHVLTEIDPHWPQHVGFKLPG